MAYTRFQRQNTTQNLGHPPTDARTEKERRQDEAIARARLIINDALTLEQSGVFIAQLADAPNRTEKIKVCHQWINTLDLEQNAAFTGQLADAADRSEKIKVCRRWADALVLERLAADLDQGAAFGAQTCRKVARRLREGGEQNLDMAVKEITGFTVSFPRYRREIEKLFLVSDKVREENPRAFGRRG